MKIILLQQGIINQKHFQAILENSGHKVRSEFSVKKGIMMLESDPTSDLVISDINLPDKGGLYLLKHVRSSFKFELLPVVLTGESFRLETVRNCLEYGASDIIVLPVDKESFASRINKAGAEAKRTILLVAEEPAIVNKLGHFFEFERYRVLIAGTAEQALQIIREEKVNIVVSDIMLPGMLGCELLANIKEVADRLPVILITEAKSKFTPEQAVASGADGVFVKPFKNTEMICTLRHVLTRC